MVEHFLASETFVRRAVVQLIQCNKNFGDRAQGTLYMLRKKPQRLKGPKIPFGIGEIPILKEEHLPYFAIERHGALLSGQQEANDMDVSQRQQEKVINERGAWFVHQVNPRPFPIDARS